MPLLTRSAAEMEALRSIAAEWQSAGLFWTYDEVIASLLYPDVIGIYHESDEGKKLDFDGFLLAKAGPDACDLIYIYVRERARQQQIGAGLMADLIEFLRLKPHIESLFLEVRVSNHPAQKLYDKFGMKVIGRRKGYYSDGEDAFIYKLELK